MSLSDIFDSEFFLNAVLLGIAIVFILFFAFSGLLFYRIRVEDKRNTGKSIETKSVKVVTITKVNTMLLLLAPFLTTTTVVLFEFDDGSRQELALNANAASTIVEKDKGMLTYQGTKFIKFERNISN